MTENMNFAVGSDEELEAMQNVGPDSLGGSLGQTSSEESPEETNT